MELPLRARRASFLAGAAMLLQLTALFLNWWVATNHTFAFTVSYGLWSNPDDLRQGAVWLTTALAVLPIPLLFLRVAARSIEHEPSSWRRDVAIAGGLMFAALASCWAWPLDMPFWGGVTFPADAGVAEQVVDAHSGLGWWVSFVALLLVAWGLWLARRGKPRAE